MHRGAAALITIVMGTVEVCSIRAEQNLSIGIIGGGSLTDAARDSTSWSYATLGTRVWSQTKDWELGITAEYRLSSRFSVEVDGMYRELHVTWAGVLPDGTLNSVSPSPVVTWEFPVLAKYRFGSGKWRPFLEGGPAFRTTGNLNFEPSRYGGTAGIGFETRWKDLAFSPVLRYTRWAPERSYGARENLQPNQLELLLGISRASESNFRPPGSRVSLGGVLGWGLTPAYPETHYRTQTLLAVPQPGGGYTYVEVDATGYQAGLRSMIAGPSIEVHWNPQVSVEIDALHKLLRSKSWAVLDDGTRQRAYSGTDAAIWQFPVLAKYRLPVRTLHPFLEAGPSFRLPQWELATYGLTAGAGVEMRWRSLRIAPAVRFTHWAAEHTFSGVRRNEAALLAGFSFGGPQ